jgi:hypothetical protein
MILRGFKWHEEQRPKSKQELFEEIKRKQDEDFDDTAPAGSVPR